MTAEQILDVLKGRLGEVQAEILPAVDRPTLVVPRDHVLDILAALRDEPSLRFALLSELTAVDWWPGEPRFQVVYLLTSIDHRLLLRVKVPLTGDAARMPTVTHLWPAAGWLEREVYDLFGIVFEGHPDLRRVLMPEDWEGYPLRKDYPVQIRMKPQTSSALQVSEEQFRANLERDRLTRR